MSNWINTGTHLKFDCGCQFALTDDPYLENLKRLSVDFDLDNIPVNCWKTWHLVGTGKTKGVFQLESYLGKKWAKELKPENLEHLGALGSILRPGSLHSFDKDGISVTQHYCNRKNGKEPVTYDHESLEPILNKTLGLNIFQENSMRLAQFLASFTLQEADWLRKSVGKKDPQLMSKVKKLFLDKAKETGIVSEEIAVKIFANIQESQRYSFNKCLTPDTIVETKEGLKTLEELEIGSFVNSPYGFVKVIDKFDNGYQEVYEVTTDTGKIINCTIDHKFLCEDMQVRPLWEILEKEYKIICEDE